MNENKSTWVIMVVKSNSFVHFLEEFTVWQFAFEINWPLVYQIFLQIFLLSFFNPAHRILFYPADLFIFEKKSYLQNNWIRRNFPSYRIIPSCATTKFGEIWHPTELFHPIELFDRLQYWPASISRVLFDVYTIRHFHIKIATLL